MFKKKTTNPPGSPPVPGGPPAVWDAFVTQGRWKNWTLIGLIAIVALQLMANMRLVSRPPEYVLVDGATGDTVLVQHSVSTDSVLRCLADKLKPPKTAIVRFSRDFIQLALGVNSSTIEANWPTALSLMTPALRARLDAEAKANKLVETYKLAQRRTDLTFESLLLLDRTDTLLAVRAVLNREVRPILDNIPGERTSDRLQVDVIARIVPATIQNPDGLEVVEWQLAKLGGAPLPSQLIPTPGAPNVQ